MSAKRPGAIFLDRDGTLIEDRHYLRDPDEVALLPGVKESFRALHAAGYALFLHTNQSGIHRGLLTWEDFWACHNRMLHLLGYVQEPFVEVGVAPERPDEPSEYRKPSPRFLLEMIEKHDLDPVLCWMVGDKPSDVRAGLKAGIHAVGLTQSGKSGLQEGLMPDELARADFFPDFAAFSRERLS